MHINHLLVKKIKLTVNEELSCSCSPSGSMYIILINISLSNKQMQGYTHIHMYISAKVNQAQIYITYVSTHLVILKIYVCNHIHMCACIK